MKKIIIVAFLLLATTTVFSQSTPTAFNFQGRLNDGSSPANGHYDLQFNLYDSITGGNLVAQTLKPDTVLVNGVFSTTLDFGQVFSSVSRFLEIGVRPAGSQNPYVILGARQRVLSVPYATHAANATHADSAGFADMALGALTAERADDSDRLVGVSGAEYLKRNVPNTGDLRLTGNIQQAGTIQQTGDIQQTGNINTTGLVSADGGLAIGGNARQNPAANGMVKAMLAVTANGTIARCYNGFTGASTGDCGGFFVLPDDALPGHYLVHFPFSVSSRFWLVTAEKSAGGVSEQTAAVSPNGTDGLFVWTYYEGSSSNRPFHLFVF